MIDQVTLTQALYISQLVIGALLLALAGDASAAMTMRDKSDKAKVLPIGFDHPNGPAKIFKSNSNPSLRLKASQVVGPLLRELCHDPKARKNSKARERKKQLNMIQMLTVCGLAPEKYRKTWEQLQKVSYCLSKMSCSVTSQHINSSILSRPTTLLMGVRTNPQEQICTLP